MNNIVLTTLTIDELKNLISSVIAEELQKSKEHTETKNQNDELIKIDDVAKMLNVSKVTIHFWKKKGFLPFYRISNKVYFKKSEVLEVLKKINLKATNEQITRP